MIPTRLLVDQVCTEWSDAVSPSLQARLIDRALAAPLDCISKKGFGSYNLALEAKALMTPTLMVSALCGSCSCNSVLQLLKTVQSNERLIQARLRLHKTQLQFWRKKHTELYVLLSALLLLTTYSYKNPMLADNCPVLHTT